MTATSNSSEWSGPRDVLLNGGDGDFLLLVPVIVCIGLVLALLLAGASTAPAGPPTSVASCPATPQPC